MYCGIKGIVLSRGFFILRQCPLYPDKILLCFGDKVSIGVSVRILCDNSEQFKKNILYSLLKGSITNRSSYRFINYPMKFFSGSEMISAALNCAFIISLCIFETVRNIIITIFIICKPLFCLRQFKKGDVFSGKERCRVYYQ